MQVPRHTLPILCKIFTFAPDILNEGERNRLTAFVICLVMLLKQLLLYEKKPDVIMNTIPDQVNLVSRKLADWLRYASIHQGVSMSSGGFFTGPRSRQVQHHVVALKKADIYLIGYLRYHEHFYNTHQQ